MILSRRVALNGVQLDEVHESIIIQSVEPADGKESITAVNAAAGSGQRMTGNRRDMLDMVVRFAINIKKNMRERAEVLELVNAWAATASAENGGAWLTVNYKKGRRLHVVLAQAPGEGSLFEFNKDFQITFRAYGVPYWEDATQTSEKIGWDKSNSIRNINIGGSTAPEVEITVRNVSGQDINNGYIMVGGCKMEFNGLGLQANEVLAIDYTRVEDVPVLRIRIGTRSVMAARTGNSCDEFRVTPGVTSVSYSFPRACRVMANWRCRYL